jgi:hypothetical protein
MKSPCQITPIPAKHCGGTAEAQWRHSGGILASAVLLLCPQNESKQGAGIRYFLVEMQKTEAGPGLKSIKKHEVPSASTFDLLLFGPSMAF